MSLRFEGTTAEVALDLELPCPQADKTSSFATPTRSDHRAVTRSDVLATPPPKVPLASPSSITLPPIVLPPEPAYMEALQHDTLPTVILTRRSHGATARPHSPLHTPTRPLSPPSGGRKALHRMRRQRIKMGGRVNVQPDPNEVGGELTLTEEEQLARPPVAKAATEFTLRHRVRSRTATAALTGLTHDPTSPRLADTFGVRLEDVFRNRFFVDDELPDLPLARAPARTKPRKPRFQLDSSVWHPRKLYGNSLDYFETAEAMRRTFDIDWGLALHAHDGFVEQMITRAEKGDAVMKQDEVVDVSETLAGHQRMLYSIFDYYACGGVTTMNAGSSDGNEIYHIDLSGFMAMCRDCKLASESCPSRMLELIFTQVDAQDEVDKRDRRHHMDRHNKQRMLNRQEFLQAIVRIGIERYVKSRKIADVSDALNTLCRTDLAPRVPAAALQDSNHFRARHCYLEQMDRVLRAHMRTLRSLFNRYADLGNASNDALDSAEMMSVGEWAALLSHLELFESGQLSFYEARLIFSWSRMRTWPEGVAASPRELREREICMRNLFFEDFMEAIVRLALLCALPTDEDLAEVGAEDAGVYLIALYHHAPSQFRAFVRDRHGDLRSPQPRQAVWRCVDHLLRYLARMIEGNTHGGKDISVSADEAAQFAKRRTRGMELNRDAAQLHDGQGGTTFAPRSGFASALQKVRERTLSSLRAVSIFAGMCDERFAVLLDSMEVAPFGEGETVFDQGTPGFTFFAILSGTATVVRTDPESGEVRTLAELAAGDCFGERALLTQEERFATVKATSKLQTVSITRKAFEDKFGSLQEAFKGTTY